MILMNRTRSILSYVFWTIIFPVPERLNGITLMADSERSDTKRNVDCNGFVNSGSFEYNRMEVYT